jgi:hypothetical protein
MYVSQKEKDWFHSDAAKKKGITPEMIAEWDKASEGKVLPESAPVVAEAKTRLVKFLKRTKKK